MNLTGPQLLLVVACCVGWIGLALALDWFSRRRRTSTAATPRDPWARLCPAVCGYGHRCYLQPGHGGQHRATVLVDYRWSDFHDEGLVTL
jgi:hypothetical protein